MDVSVIIVNYNTLQMTKECIDSIVKCTSDVEYEIILVDNASTDGSRDFFENDKRIKYIYSDRNNGFGKANNIGVSNSCGEYIFMLNSDTLLKNNALSYLLQFHKENEKKNIGFIGCELVDINNHVNGSGSRFPTLANELGRLFHLSFHKETTLSTFPYKVDYVLGADMFVSRNVFNQVGGFDEQFFMYYEESDLQRRTHALGYSNYIIYGPKIVHLEGKSTKGVTLSKRLMVDKSRFLYLRKYYCAVSYILFRIIYAVFGLRVMLCKSLTLKEKNIYIRTLVR